jgi:hypothetical protein
MTPSRYLEMFKGTKEAQKHLLSKPHCNIWRDQKDNAETVDNLLHKLWTTSAAIKTGGFISSVHGLYR